MGPPLWRRELDPRGAQRRTTDAGPLAGLNECASNQPCVGGRGSSAPTRVEFVIILECINCGNFIGFDNGTTIEIKHEGVLSYNKINVITLKAINIKVQGDINMINSTIDNFASKTFTPNDIIFHKVIDTKSNNVLGYKNSDASNNFNYVLSKNNSGQINFFDYQFLIKI